MDGRRDWVCVSWDWVDVCRDLADEPLGRESWCTVLDLL